MSDESGKSIIRDTPDCFREFLTIMSSGTEDYTKAAMKLEAMTLTAFVFWQECVAVKVAGSTTRRAAPEDWEL